MNAKYVDFRVFYVFNDNIEFNTINLAVFYNYYNTY